MEAAIAEVWAERNVQKLALVKQSRQRTIDAFLDGKFKQDLFDQQLAKVEADLESAGAIDADVTPDQDELNRLLSFVEWFLGNAASVWYGAEPDKKKRIQAAIFPLGLTVTSEGFGTPAVWSLFNDLRDSIRSDSILASPGGFEPPLSP